MSNIGEARILPPVPAIASEGQVVGDCFYLLMQLAADRLNEDPSCTTSYKLTATKQLLGERRVYLRGLWVDSLLQDEHLLNFLGQVAELETELSATTRDWPYGPLALSGGF